MRQMKPEDRIIVAADFEPSSEEGGKINPTDKVVEQVLSLARELEGTGVYIKVNSALVSDGSKMISNLHDLGLRVFADLKLNDIPKTMEYYAKLMHYHKPELLTVMCSSGIDGMRSVADVFQDLPDTEILGVTVLTSLDEETCKTIYGKSLEDAVQSFAKMAEDAGLQGLILSTKEALAVRSVLGDSLTLNTPGIRPEWSIVPDDDQSRFMTLVNALKQNINRFVIGRPITLAAPNDEGRPQSPREAVERTLEEIRAHVAG